MRSYAELLILLLLILLLIKQTWKNCNENLDTEMTILLPDNRSEFTFLTNYSKSLFLVKDDSILSLILIWSYLFVSREIASQIRDNFLINVLLLNLELFRFKLFLTCVILFQYKIPVFLWKRFEFFRYLIIIRRWCFWNFLSLSIIYLF